MVCYGFAVVLIWFCYGFGMVFCRFAMVFYGGLWLCCGFAMVFRWFCYDFAIILLLFCNGLIDVYRKTLKSDGIQGIYRGFAISCVGIFVYRGMYFGLYDSLKPLLLGQDANALLSFFLGWAVTIVSGLMSYPIDTVRRRMMMTAGTGTKYNGSLDCFTQVVKNEGFMSLMKGAGANILRGVAGAGVLAGFDVVKKAYIDFRTK